MISVFHILSLLLVSLPLVSQVTFSSRTISLGSLGSVSEIAGDVVITNPGEAKVHLLRADAEGGMKVFTSKRTLHPGDTALLVISFVPEHRGKFSRTVTVYTSEKNGAYAITLTGQIENVRRNDLTACYYFGSSATDRGRRPSPTVTGENVAPAPGPPGMGHISRPAATSHSAPVTKPKIASTSTPSAPLDGHVPNNLLLLLDISSSMRDSLKLPLLKSEMHTLINAIRDVDSVSLVTYADTVKTRYEAVSGKEKERLHQMVDALKARGMTKGKKAILYSQQVAQKHYINGGNNLIILASDGKFNFTPEDQKLYTERQDKGRVLISTVAFGDDREALRTLKKIASQGGGSFIHITRRSGHSRLLEEVQARSRVADKR
jgi:Mg-chelatase subunit ChlD